MHTCAQTTAASFDIDSARQCLCTSNRPQMMGDDNVKRTSRFYQHVLGMNGDAIALALLYLQDMLQMLFSAMDSDLMPRNSVNLRSALMQAAQGHHMVETDLSRKDVSRVRRATMSDWQMMNCRKLGSVVMTAA